jgi:hypothetical protein
MQSFLDKVANHVLSQKSLGLENVCIVTPNRRAGLFLKRYFAQKITTSVWAPDILSMEDFCSSITGVTIQEPIALLLDFYEVYHQQEKELAEKLDEFMKWAPMLIKDFNDIDAQLEQPRQIFDNILDIKRIETWNTDGKPLTDFQQKYIAFFKKFSKWHELFANALIEKHTAYQGLAYRMAARTLAKEDAPELRWKFIYFAGFNALNQSEESIIRGLVRKGLAEVVWDTDKYYMHNRNHEAGLFLRKYKSQWGLKDFSFEGDYFSIQKKNIRLYGVAKNVNQAKLAGKILKDIPEEDINHNHTAVVLANEDLLLPMLNSIPGKIEKVNITMGFPIRKTSIYSLFDAVFQMHITTLRMKTARPGAETAFYFKDLARFFRHPAISILLNQHFPEQSAEVFITKLFESKKTFIYFSTLATFWSNENKFYNLFAPWFADFVKDPTRIITALKQLIQTLDQAFLMEAQKKNLPIENTPWFTDFEALFSINTLLQKLRNSLEIQEQIKDLRILFMLFQAMAKESKLVLSGDPLAGLQVMGMLETRNLDFKNLVILSANEDIMPASKNNTSIIPFDVKTGFGIPVHKEKDAIYAYHFYRLLQRAENVHIIYNTQKQDMGSSEKSRFLTQLIMEMPQYNPNINITEDIISLPSASHDVDDEIVIPKSAEILEELNKINSKGYSPTTLNHFIKCSLFFYFKHIIKVEETVLPEETLQANTLGTVVHGILEQLYEDEKLPGNTITTDHINRMIARAEKVTALNFKKHYKGGDVSSGKNLLLAKVALRYVRNFLDTEKALIKNLKEKNKTLQYIKSEEELRVLLPLNLGTATKDIFFRGFADRIDKLDNTIRIIDYKTGKVEDKDLVVKEWDALAEDSDLGKSFQLLMYAMLYRRKHGNSQAVQPGIISFRNLTAGMLALKTPESKELIDDQILKEFETQLTLVLQNIYDPNQPFTRTSDEKKCINCDFKKLCNR